MQPNNYYATPELAGRYDREYAGRLDLPFYVDLAVELNAKAVGDVGAGTGLLCSLLIEAGINRVVGVEPQDTMLSLARQQPFSDRVEWIKGTTVDLPRGALDLVIMTGHVAQYFLDDESWSMVLVAIGAALTPYGRVLFEIRNAAREAWQEWNHELYY
jgi:2-polyprenyl-3-methyl-5-hydroxy-6-metoxy-1,4-benzoquinol methylase